MTSAKDTSQCRLTLMSTTISSLICRYLTRISTRCCLKTTIERVRWRRNWRTLGTGKSSSRLSAPLTTMAIEKSELTSANAQKWKATFTNDKLNWNKSNKMTKLLRRPLMRDLRRLKLGYEPIESDMTLEQPVRLTSTLKQQRRTLWITQFNVHKRINWETRPSPLKPTLLLI